MGYEPSAIIHAENGEKHLFLSSNVMLQAIGNRVHKIRIDPYLSGDLRLSYWEFGPFKYNQSMDEAINVASDDSFFFDNVLELDKGKYVMKVFFEEEKVKSLEVSLY
ncbi:hypothetical protein OPS25_02280 [Alteromonas ponticola]|uniref:Uncharacterized protein n=1 Tax=Alteromonas aquimaris TaxID=2998417 RepID=A0ABT3P3K3_9ALTE|nr:hypothetical protein [Alteromonas aquimaris]MCW8107332.1 hypothetical protein [Alteromonas aquimaris]